MPKVQRFSHIFYGLGVALLQGGLIFFYHGWQKLHPFYLSAILGAAAALNFACSWGSFLYRDNFLQVESRRLEQEATQVATKAAEEIGNGEVNTKPESAKLYRQLRHGLVPNPTGSRGTLRQDGQRVLLWSTLFLFTYTIWLYYAYGIGASYFL